MWSISYAPSSLFMLVLKEAQLRYDGKWYLLSCNETLSVIHSRAVSRLWCRLISRYASIGVSNVTCFALWICDESIHKLLDILLSKLQVAWSFDWYTLHVLMHWFHVENCIYAGKIWWKFFMMMYVTCMIIILSWTVSWHIPSVMAWHPLWVMHSGYSCLVYCWCT